MKLKKHFFFQKEDYAIASTDKVPTFISRHFFFTLLKNMFMQDLLVMY